MNLDTTKASCTRISTPRRVASATSFTTYSYTDRCMIGNRRDGWKRNNLRAVRTKDVAIAKCDDTGMAANPARTMAAPTDRYT